MRPTEARAIDIDDFEQRLRSQEARRASQGDPLRELARLMQEPETDVTAQRYAQIFDDHHQPAEEAEADYGFHHMRRTRPRKPPLRRSTTTMRNGGSRPSPSPKRICRLRCAAPLAHMNRRATPRSARTGGVGRLRLRQASTRIATRISTRRDLLIRRRKKRTTTPMATLGRPRNIIPRLMATTRISPPSPTPSRTRGPSRSSAASA